MLCSHVCILRNALPSVCLLFLTVQDLLLDVPGASCRAIRTIFECQYFAHERQVLIEQDKRCRPGVAPKQRSSFSIGTWSLWDS